MAVNCSVNANPGQHNNKQLIHFWNVKEYLKEMKGEFHNTATLLPLMDIKDINNELTIEFAESKVVKCYKSSVSLSISQDFCNGSLFCGFLPTNEF